MRQSLAILLVFACAGVARADSTTVPHRTPRVPAQLAATAPEAQRAATTALYSQLLAAYESSAPKYRIAAHDVGAALALYLAASYAVYRDVDVPDEQLTTLARQMQTVLASSPAFAKLSIAQRQDEYERYAILGMMMAMARGRPLTPEARAAAKGYLEAFAGRGADSVAISARGLALDGVVMAPAASPEPPAATTADAGAPPSSARATQLPPIAGIVYDQVAYKGMTPIILFRSGKALLDARGLTFARGVAAHEAENPRLWTTWQRAGKGYEIRECFRPGDGCTPRWHKVAYDALEPLLPKGHRYEATLRASSSPYNVNVAAVFTSYLTLTRAGRFTELNSSAHVVTVGTGTESHGGVSGSGRKEAGGTYAIDGALLTLHYDDGRVAVRSIVGRAVAKPALVWLDGTSYASMDD